MATLTICVNDRVYAWLADKAAQANISVQALIEKEVQQLPQGDPEDPEFVSAMEATIAANQNLLKRLAQ